MSQNTKKFLSKRTENEVYEIPVENIKIAGVRGSYFHTEHVEVIVDYVVDVRFDSSIFGDITLIEKQKTPSRTAYCIWIEKLTRKGSLMYLLF